MTLQENEPYDTAIQNLAKRFRLQTKLYVESRIDAESYKNAVQKIMKDAKDVRQIARGKAPF